MKKIRVNKLDLIAISKNRKESSSVVAVSRDGWVVTENGAMGDHKQDCNIVWAEQKNYIKTLREHKNISQQELAWILGVSRSTVIAYEKGKAEMTHKEFLLTQCINENF